MGDERGERLYGGRIDQLLASPSRRSLRSNVYICFDYKRWPSSSAQVSSRPIEDGVNRRLECQSSMYMFIRLPALRRCRSAASPAFTESRA